MNKIRNVLVVLIALLFASSAWAAGTVIVQSDKLVSGLIGKETREITYLVTFGADATSPAATALDAILKSNGLKATSVGGWWLLEVSTLFGSTGPTDNTDLYIYRNTGTNKIDVLGSTHPGENAIDNATNNTINPATTTRPLYGDELLTISGNLVNSATVQIVMTLYR